MEYVTIIKKEITVYKKKILRSEFDKLNSMEFKNSSFHRDAHISENLQGKMMGDDITFYERTTIVNDETGEKLFKYNVIK